MQKLRTFALLFTCLLVTDVFGQAPPVMTAQRAGKPVSIQLAKLDAKVRLLGFVAETELVMTFRNSHDRQLEGDFCLPLPAGATVSGYALDINGKMVDGVVVERNRGRTVYQRIVRKQIDPGLTEWNNANSFRTRVFPIPPKGTRTIMVRYTSVLSGKNYQLPLQFAAHLDQVSLQIESLGTGTPPSVEKMDDVTFTESGTGYTAKVSLKTLQLSKPIVIALPKLPANKPLITRSKDGFCYFAIRSQPQLPKAPAEHIVPKKITILWDASGSRERSYQPFEISLLHALFGEEGSVWQGRKEKAPTVHVDLIVLRHRAEKPLRFTVRPGAEKLIAHIKAIAYDGGTRLGALPPMPKAEAPDYYLLFSDGRNTVGESRFGTFKAPVYVIASDLEADAPSLLNLAVQTRGGYINLLRTEVKQARTRIGARNAQLVETKVSDRKDVELYPSGAAPLSNGATILVGRTKKSLISLQPQYSNATDPAQTEILQATAIQSEMIRHVWAREKLDELLIQKLQNRRAIIRLGQEFGMVTPYTSLIVLESLEQYLQYRIVPPATMPDMRKKYLTAVGVPRKPDDPDGDPRTEEKISEEIKAKQQEYLIAALAKQWQERVDWWNKEFKYKEGFKYSTYRRRTKLLADVQKHFDDCRQYVESENYTDARHELESAEQVLLKGARRDPKLAKKLRKKVESEKARFQDMLIKNVQVALREHDIEDASWQIRDLEEFGVSKYRISILLSSIPVAKRKRAVHYLEQAKKLAAKDDILGAELKLNQIKEDDPKLYESTLALRQDLTKRKPRVAEKVLAAASNPISKGEFRDAAQLLQQVERLDSTKRRSVERVWNRLQAEAVKVARAQLKLAEADIKAGRLADAEMRLTTVCGASATTAAWANQLSKKILTALREDLAKITTEPEYVAQKTRELAERLAAIPESRAKDEIGARLEDDLDRELEQDQMYCIKIRSISWMWLNVRVAIRRARSGNRIAPAARLWNPNDLKKGLDIRPWRPREGESREAVVKRLLSVASSAKDELRALHETMRHQHGSAYGATGGNNNDDDFFTQGPPAPKKPERIRRGPDRVPRELGAQRLATGPQVRISRFASPTQYLTAIKTAAPDRRYAAYLEQRGQHGGNPIFFIICSDYFYEAGNAELGLQILLNVAEMELPDARILRTMARRLVRAGEFNLAIRYLEDARQIDGSPFTLRELALAYEARGEERLQLLKKNLANRDVTIDGMKKHMEEAGALPDFRRAAQLFSEAAEVNWIWTSDVDQMSLLDLNTLYARRLAEFGEPFPVSNKLRKPMPLDLRIVLTTEAGAGLDLQVIEPSGEEISEDHDRSVIGGFLSAKSGRWWAKAAEYSVKKAAKGEYRLRGVADKWGRLGGEEALVQLDIYTNYGRENQTRKTSYLRIKIEDDPVDLGVVTF